MRLEGKIVDFRAQTNRDIWGDRQIEITIKLVGVKNYQQIIETIQKMARGVVTVSADEDRLGNG